MPRSLRLPSGRQRLALAVGHDDALCHPDLAPEAGRAQARLQPDLAERFAALPGMTADLMRAAFGGGDDAMAEQDIWAPQIPEWADAGERTAHGYTLVDNVALMEIEGVLMARGFTGWWSGCYWPGYRDYVAALQAANEDERVDAVLIRFDTPGGFVSGCAEAARAIRALRADSGGKPIVGHAGELCASAGMKLAAQCDEFYAADGAIVGSVGVRIGFFDFEGAMERWGERYHLYKSGRLKDMGSPLRAPTDEEAEIYQAEVDHLADRFYVELAAGRMMDVSAVRESRGWEARTFTAGDPPPPEALDPLAVDLIDGVMTEEQAFAQAQALATAAASLGAPRPPSTQSLPAPNAATSRAAGSRDKATADSKETKMSLKTRITALRDRANGGDANAREELDGILAAINATAAYDDDAEGADDDDAEGMDDDASAEGEDDDAAAAEGEDDDADAENDGEDDAEAVLNHPAAQGRERLAGRLSVRVARGKLTKAEAIADLKAAPKGSGMRAAAGFTPPGAKSGSPGSGKRESTLVASAKKIAGLAG